MATPLLTASTRYTDQATTRVYWVPSIAASNLTPTRVELDAGTDVTNELNDLSGWNVEGEQIDTQSMGERFRSRIPGSTSSEDSSLTFFASKTGNDIRVLNPRGTEGNIAWMDGGDTSGNKMEVFPVTVMSVGLIRTTVGEDATKIVVNYSITKEPGQNLTIP